ncbi:MAG: DNA gyrase subunit A [Rhodospirillales bacterium]|nr:DNA gyrase subunit A [Rhodospirillales bacterium]
MTATPPVSPGHDIAPVTIEEEMKRSYLDYAMSVIVSRALPDVRDGLKPVHRRILYAMNESGYEWNKPFRKSARIVGDVMGKYHPHGDSAIYDAMVRMAQNFSMRLPLIDGQGNFGSMDGDPPAAMRYTEARLTKAAHSLIDDIGKETVDFQSNYDDTVEEPTVLPARFPNLLVNGAGGIAVGMATNIPPHNLGEVIDACCAYIDDPKITIEKVMEIVLAPDFPTGGIILGRSGIRSAFTTGRGSVVVRGRAEIEEIRKDRLAIVISEVPYQVNKARMLELMAELVRDKRIEGISDLRDESDRDGMRVVVELKRDAVPDVVLNQLYKFTPLQSSFGVNMLALNGGKPVMMSLQDIIAAFVAFREEVVTRRTIYELGKARDRAHTLVGLAIAVANLDAVIKLIREAPDPATARERLMSRDWEAFDVEPLVKLIDEPDRKVVNGCYRLSEAQAKAILDLRLHRLTGLERDKIAAELTEIGGEIAHHLAVLGSRDMLYGIIRAELVAMKDEFATPRRTEIQDLEFESDIEDLIQREDMVVTVTASGYIKRVPLAAYRAQRRGGKGRSAMSMREEDVLSQVFVASTHAPILFFSSTGIVYKMKVYRLPLGTPQAKGKAMVNLLPLKDGEVISTVLPLSEDEDSMAHLHVMFATSSGSVRRNELADFLDVRANGKIAMKLDEGERLIGVAPCTEDANVLLAAYSGKCIRFPVEDVRLFKGRDSTGVRGIQLAEGDRVISMSILKHVDFDPPTRDAYLKISKRQRGEEGGETDNGDAALLSPELYARLAETEEFILTVTENGFGKRSSAYEYRVAGRGGLGIANIDCSERNGQVVASFPVEAMDHLLLVTDGGTIIRLPVEGIRIAGRVTQGVTLIKVAEGEKVVSVSRLPADENEVSESEEETGEEEPSSETVQEENGDA